MKAHIWLEIQGKIDSMALWEQIKRYGVNVTDLCQKTLVYGEVDFITAGTIISICSMHGDIEATVKR